MISALLGFASFPPAIYFMRKMWQQPAVAYLSVGAIADHIRRDVEFLPNVLDEQDEPAEGTQ